MLLLLLLALLLMVLLLLVLFLLLQRTALLWIGWGGCRGVRCCYRAGMDATRVAAA